MVRAARLIQLPAVHVMRVRADLVTPGPVVPHTLVPVVLDIQDLEGLPTMVLGGLHIQVPAVHVMRVQVVRATRAQAERAVSVPRYADNPR
jgi:hypothetical protein